MTKIKRQVINTTFGSGKTEQVYKNNSNQFFIEYGDKMRWVKIERIGEKKYFKKHNVFGYRGEVFGRLNVYTPWASAFDCIIVVK